MSRRNAIALGFDEALSFDDAFGFDEVLGFDDRIALMANPDLLGNWFRRVMGSDAIVYKLALAQRGRIGTTLNLQIGVRYQEIRVSLVWPTTALPLDHRDPRVKKWHKLPRLNYPKPSRLY